MQAPRQRLAFIIVAPFLFLLSGCGLLNLQNLVASSASGVTASTSFTGNYAFTGVPASSTAALPSPVLGFLGAVTNSGSQFTATLRLLTTNQCLSPTQDVTFTGTNNSSTGIMLTSTNLPQNPISITWLDDPTQSSNGVGSYTITGSGPCTQSATNFVSDQFSPLTGTYTGTFVSTGGVSATVSAALTQAPANADGQFPETGTLVLTTSSCTNTFALTGVVTGPTLTAVFNQTAPGTLGGFVAVLPDHVLVLNIPTGITVLGSCNPGTFNGTLALQP